MLHFLDIPVLKVETQTEEVQETIETPSAYAGTPSSVSRSSVKSRASKSSVKSDSGSQTSLKKDVTTSTEVAMFNTLICFAKIDVLCHFLP